MRDLLVEVIGSYNCVGYKGNMPNIVKQFAEETNSQICFKSYNVWDENSYIDMPEYILSKIESIESGNEENTGFFLNGNWLALGYHNAYDMTTARRKLEEAIGITSEQKNIYKNAYEIKKMDVHNCTVDNIITTDSFIKEFSTYTNEFDKILLFGSKIKYLDIDFCFVDKFTFNGFDILKLIEIAKENPELLNKVYIKGKKQDGTKMNIDEINIKLITGDDLKKGFHPCCITGSKVDPHNMLYQTVSDVYGGWGYIAEHSSQTCGFLGIVPKEIAVRNVMGVPCPNDGINPKDVLLITCIAGGDAYNSQYASIGVATKLVRQVIKDAREKGYKYIEGTQNHPGVHSILEKVGFTRKEWLIKDCDLQSNRNVYYFLDLNII